MIGKQLQKANYLEATPQKKNEIQSPKASPSPASDLRS